MHGGIGEFRCTGAPLSLFLHRSLSQFLSDQHVVWHVVLSFSVSKSTHCCNVLKGILRNPMTWDLGLGKEATHVTSTCPNRIEELQ